MENLSHSLLSFATALLSFKEFIKDYCKTAFIKKISNTNESNDISTNSGFKLKLAKNFYFYGFVKID